MTEADRRAAEVRARRAPRVPKSEELERQQIEAREIEQWIDEGSVRDAAEAATARAASPNRNKPTARDVDPDVSAEIGDAVEQRRAERLTERLAAAAHALDRERFDEARKLAAPLVRELPGVAAVHEVSGLANYRLGRWQHAAKALEMAQSLRATPETLPVLADCYRALKRYDDVDKMWLKIREESPSHQVMIEARIVAAGALADRGELKQAIELMEQAGKAPKRVREHHLRQWYVLADLHDRAGNTVAATRWFTAIAQQDPGFVDVTDRLRALGR